MLVEPQLQRGSHEVRNQTHRIARIEPFLDLPLKLGIQHLGRQHVAGPGKHILGHELDALGQQGVQVDEALDGLKQAIAQAALMGAAGRGRDQVDIALAHRLAVFGEGHAPLHSHAFGKALMGGVGIALALEHRNDRVGTEGLLQVVVQSALVEPGLGFAGFLMGEADAHAGHQHRLAAQQVHQLGHR